MRPFQNIRIAIEALRANKLRSALTMLGIIIGVGSVVSLLSVGNGAQESILAQINGIGTNLVTVVPGVLTLNTSRPPAAGSIGAGARPLTDADARAIEERVSNISGVAPEFTANGTTITFKRTNILAAARAVTPDYLMVRNQTIGEGRWIESSDMSTAARVVVLGADAAESLFGELSPIGERIKVANVPFTVIGVLNRVGGGFTGNPDQSVYVPLTTGYRSLFGSRAAYRGDNRVSVIYISALNNDELETVAEEVTTVLRSEHRLKIDDEDDFTVLTQEQFLSIAGAITGILTIFLGAIAGISLLVGGIGIMNISLVSVTERTKEIGLRKAVGAKRRTILIQFLVETVTLSVIGGFAGIFLGWMVATLISATGVLQATVTPNSVALAVGFSFMVGLFFGIYPASRAAALQPIEALRYE